MSNTASLKKEYQDRIVPALTKEFGYKSIMQVSCLEEDRDQSGIRYGYSR